MEVSDLGGLLRGIEKVGSKAPLEIIGVEGHSTSGKTWLSERIGAHFGWTVIGSDSCLREGCETKQYIDCLDAKKLKTAVSRAARPLVIEGIALGDSLERISVDADLTIYCKRISPAGLWVDDPLNYETEGVPDPGLSMVDYWSVEYHRRNDPAAEANLVFSWVES